MTITNKILSIILFFLSINFSHAQAVLWPFKDNTGIVKRGNITGTVGDFREWRTGTPPVRFHAGTDFTSYYDVQNFPSQSRSVYSMHAGTVVAINMSTCLASYIAIQLPNGSIVYYKHIAPSKTDPVTGATVVPIALNSPVQVGTFLGQMIISSTCNQHVHINDNNNTAASLPGTTNFIHNFVTPFTDTYPPDFIYPFNSGENVVADDPSNRNNAVEFHQNGHRYDNATALLDQSYTINSVTYKVAYDKVDIVSRMRDRKILTTGAGGTDGNNGINIASYQLLTAGNSVCTPEIANINFNTVPTNDKALYVFDNRSQLGDGPTRHVYILTGNPLATPYDRFWNTRLRQGQTEDWNLTSRGSKDARCVKEAQYPDDVYILRLRAKDISNQQGTSSNTTTRDVSVLIDNFRPYVEDVLVLKNNNAGSLVYHGYRQWLGASGTLNFPADTQNDAGPQDNIWMQITISEPAQNVRVNIPNVDGTTYLNATVVPNTNNTKFIVIHNPITITGSQYFNIQATDFAGNPLQTDPSVIPVRQPDGTWGAGVSPGIDNSHHFNTGTGTCSGSAGGRMAANARTSSGCLYADFSPNKFSPAVGEAVTFTPVAAGNGVIMYSWDFGPGATPATSTSSGPQAVIYSTSGAKTVSLKICDKTTACVTDTQTGIVNIGAPPSQLTVNFSADRLGGDIGNTINLTSSVTGVTGSASYAWDFGEGLASGQFSDVNPVITYNTPGNKTIQLRVTDANGSVTTVKNNYLIITSSAFNVSVSILSGCGTTGANGSASFFAAVSGGNGPPYDSYMWDFGDGSTSNSSGIVTHTYKKSGKYTIRLTACDETGCGTAESVDCVTVPSIVDASTLSADFTINGILQGPFYSAVDVGLNTPVAFADATTGGGDPSTFTYYWDFESHYYNSTGIESAVPATALVKGAIEVYYTVAGLKEVSLSVRNQRTSAANSKGGAVDVVAGMGSGRCFATLGDATISSTCWSPTSIPKFTVPVLKSNCPVAKTEVIYWVNPGQGVVLPNNKLDFTAMGLPVPDFPLTADFSFTGYQYDGVSYNRIGYKRQRFTIYGPVSADAGADKQICLSASTTLGNALTNNLSYAWTTSVPGNLNFLSSPNLANPVFTGIQKGSYTYSLKVTDNQSGCVSALDNVTITVDRPEIQSSTFILPLGASNLTIGTSGGFGTNVYSWFPASNLSSATVLNPIFNSSVDGNFNYRLR